MNSKVQFFYLKDEHKITVLARTAKETKLTSLTFNDEAEIFKSWKWFSYDKATSFELIEDDLIKRFILEKHNEIGEVDFLTINYTDILGLSDKNLIEKEIIFYQLQVLIFNYFNENPENVNEFGLFEEIKKRSGDDGYQVEDWLIDMENGLGFVIGKFLKD